MIEKFKNFLKQSKELDTRFKSLSKEKKIKFFSKLLLISVSITFFCGVVPAVVLAVCFVRNMEIYPPLILSSTVAMLIAAYFAIFKYFPPRKLLGILDKIEKA